MLTLKEAVEAGRMLGIMVDRALASDRTVTVDFLGGRARFPVGPWQMAHALGVPIILGFGVYHGGNRYTAHFELFAEHLRLPRDESRSRHRGIRAAIRAAARAIRARRSVQLVQFLRLLAAGACRPIMNPLRVSTYTVSSAVGAGRAAHVQALRAGTTGLGRLAFDTNNLDCWLGEVRDFDVPLTGALADLGLPQQSAGRVRARARIGFLDAVAASRARYGATRVGVFIGTSTSGVQHTELAYRARDAATGALPGWFDQRRTQNIFSVAAFVALRLGLTGPALSISTACSSSAKVFAAASRAIAAGVCDAAVVGGVDSLCLTTLYGFNSLQLISADICRPADAARLGISIGEAGGFALLDPSAESSAGAARIRRDQRCVSHVLARARRPRRHRIHARGTGARQCRARRGRLHQSARHRHDRQRQRREPRGLRSVRQHHAM